MTVRSDIFGAVIAFALWQLTSLAREVALWSVRIPVVICHVVRIPVLVESTLAKFLFGFGFVPNHFSRLLVLLKLWYHCPSSQRYQIPFLALSTNQSGGSLRVEVDNLRVQEPAGIRGNIKFFDRTVFSAFENTQIPNLSFKFSLFHQRGDVINAVRSWYKVETRRPVEYRLNLGDN